MLREKGAAKKKISLILAMVLIITMSNGLFPLSQASPESLLQGLEVWYKFDETSGTVAADSSGNGHHANLVGGANWSVAAGMGLGLNLDNAAGQSKHVVVPNNILQNVPGDFTISTWIKVKAADAWTRIIDFGPANNNNIMFWCANSYFFAMGNANGFDAQPSSIWPVNNYDQWQFATITRQGTTTRIWVNGINYGSNTYSTSVSRTGTGQNFYIGRANWNDPFPDMMLRDFRIYNRALSAAEIMELKEASDYSEIVAVKIAIDTFNLGNTSAVTENLYLPKSLGQNVSVDWISDSGDISVQGEVGVITRPPYGGEPVAVKLTARFSKEEYWEEKEYIVTILPKTNEVHRLTVDAAKPGIEISPTLYGIFYEDINHAADGGLYAELVRNRSFDDSSSSLPHWSVYTNGSGAGAISVTTSNRLNANRARGLSLNISSAPAGAHVGIRNAGYWGMNFVAGDSYDLTFYARQGGSPSYTGSLTAVLLDDNGSVISTPVSSEPIAADWTKYEMKLTANSGAPRGNLVIYGQGGTGNIVFGMVSLFPKTWKDRPNGLRTDIAEMIADMKPMFNRFPGGCFSEGDNMANAFRWKNTIGDISQREGHWNLWGYRTTDGLGYHEFLQFSEDLGAEPLYVFNVGMAHSGNEDPAWWVQDALDAIEYANGDITTRWGAERAKNGHPEPFNMKYVEVGNEMNFQSAMYTARYQLFYDAVRAKYPYMNIIADMDMTDKTIDIVDEHYYSNPQFFIDNAFLYDSYNRNGYKVYVGEYAVTQGCGLGNLHAAIGEAAYMTGMERNSDQVIMTSYAPLLVNTNDRTWNPDAINYDSSRSYGTPAYYNQVLFGQNVGDVVLPTTFYSDDVPTSADISGRIGLGTWATNVSYSNVKVTSNSDGSILMQDNFTNMSAWTTNGSGNWSVSGGLLNQTSTSATDCRILAGDVAWSNYTYEVTARKNSGSEGFLIIIGGKDLNNYYWLNLGGWNNTRSTIEKAVGGAKHDVVQSISGAIVSNRNYQIKIIVSGRNIKCYIDGSLWFDYTDREGSEEPLYYVSSRDNITGDIIMKVANVTGKSYDTNVVITGASGLGAAATATVLSSPSLNDENSFANPVKITPVTTTVNAGASFDYNFAKNSVTVLRIPTSDKPYQNINIVSAQIHRISADNLLAGETEQLSFSALTAGGETVLEGATIAYFSGDTSLGIIDNNGLLKIRPDIGNAISLKVWAHVIWHKQVVSTNALIIPLGEKCVSAPELALAPSGTNRYTATATVLNRTGEPASNVMLIIAAYSESGKMVDMVYNAAELGALSKQTFTVDIDVTGKDVHLVKAFVWNNYIPVCADISRYR